MIDEADRKILRELQRNARIPVTELAKRVGLSKTPVAVRIRHLEETGVISAYRAVVSPFKLGLSHVTFVEVRLTDTREAALKKFNEAVKLVPEIEECYMIAGGFDYLIKVRSKDIAHYRDIMGDAISALPYVNSTSTHVAMETVVEPSEIVI
ncbi:Leucine-responsive regulatory protein [Aquimixticola soesokkakensis]|uniref:Leucine-responsive regulatory protein n=1 Tax=Aquimixticola soesokkakensis TaxID=1519096 RepID=A0A1Y5T5Q3_9RHOB|nr:Lrp/AsnC ligand binding domain-containing protein [Aquimixticola soesokkakensis]SLN55879.1 Leucine-responsive regulatory protein [Aquimixticola soesokkakensis]